MRKIKKLLGYLFFFLPLTSLFFLNFNPINYKNSCISTNGCPHVLSGSKMQHIEMSIDSGMLSPDMLNIIGISKEQDSSVCNDSYCWICSKNFPFKKEDIINNFRISHKTVDYYFFPLDTNLLYLNTKFKRGEQISAKFYTNFNLMETIRLNC